MAQTYISKPYFLTGSNSIDIYSCPTLKKAIVKQIAIANESPSGTYVSVFWKSPNIPPDGGGTYLGTTILVGTTFPQFTLVNSGQVTAFGKLHALDDFLSISGGDIISCKSENGMRLSVLLSALEQDTIY